MTVFRYVLHWQHWWGPWLTIPARFMCKASSVVYTLSEIHTLSNIWGKVPIFNGGDKHHVITPKKWFTIFSINFSIPESIPSHSTDFIVDVSYKHKNFKVNKFLNSLQNLRKIPISVQNCMFKMSHTTIIIAANTLKFLAHVANSGWFNRNFLQNFFMYSFCVREFFVIIVQYTVVSNNWWIHPT